MSRFSVWTMVATLAFTLPAPGVAQVGDCWGCGSMSSGGCVYSICQGEMEGWGNCAQQMGDEHLPCPTSACSPYGGSHCVVQARLDGSASAPTLEGFGFDVLKALLGGEGSELRRPCDAAIVAREYDPVELRTHRDRVRTLRL